MQQLMQQQGMGEEQQGNPTASMQPQTGPEAQTTEGATGQEYQPSDIGSQNGFPEGPQTSANPLVEQAMQDFQGAGGGTGQDNTPEAPAKKKPAAKKPSEGKGGKGHTININVSGEKSEKTASVDFWKGIVEGY